MMINRLRAPSLSLFLILLGCTSGIDEGQREPGKSGGMGGGGGVTHGAAGIPNQTSAGASATSAGSAGSTAGVSGSIGVNTGPGTSGGAPFVAGGGSRDDGAGAGGRGPAATFSIIYDTIITPNCGGSQCHLKHPTPFGYDFSSKSAASASWRSDVIAGDAASSPMFQVLDFAIMPKDKPPLSIEQLHLVYDWINAGALDN
jgi:hypothetical protein